MFGKKKHNGTIAILVAVVMSLTAFAVTASTEPVAEGFEVGALTDCAWRGADDGVLDGTQFSLSNAQAYAGENSLLFTGSASITTQRAMLPVTQLEAGSDYVAETWYFLGEGANTGTLEFAYSGVKFLSDGGLKVTQSVALTNMEVGKWHRMSIRFKQFDDGANMRQRIGITRTNGGETNLYIDAVSIRPMSNLLDYSAAGNTDFETFSGVAGTIIGVKAYADSGAKATFSQVEDAARGGVLQTTRTSVESGTEAIVGPYFELPKFNMGIQNGTMLQCSFKAKASTNCRLRLRLLNNKKEDGTSSNEDFYFNGTTTWKEYTVNVPIYGAATTYYAYVYSYLKNEGDNVMLDDVSITCLQDSASLRATDTNYIVESVENNKSYTPHFYLGKADAERTAVCITAVYCLMPNNLRVLETVQYETKSIAAETVLDYTATAVSIPSEGNYQVKCMIWDGGMKPYLLPMYATSVAD